MVMETDLHNKEAEMTLLILLEGAVMSLMVMEVLPFFPLFFHLFHRDHLVPHPSGAHPLQATATETT